MEHIQSGRDEAPGRCLSCHQVCAITWGQVHQWVPGVVDHCDQQTLQHFTILENKTISLVNASVYLWLWHRAVTRVKQGLYRYSHTAERKILSVDAFLCVSVWPALVYIPACVDIIRMLCVRGTPALFFIFLFFPVSASQSPTVMGVFAWWKPQKQRSSVCFDKGNVHASAWTLHWCAGKKKTKKKHVINKINSTSPLLVTQHRDQGMWKAEGRW